MFSNLPIYKIIFLNFALMLTWHILTLILCQYLKTSFFNPKKYLYSPKKWEKGGLFYIKILKIKKWKDHLPQYISKEGFSKKSLLNHSMLHGEYLEKFITETCRAEWNHLVCCCYFAVAFFVNSFLHGIVFSLVPIICNLPYVAIQRFNRIRLQKLQFRDQN